MVKNISSRWLIVGVGFLILGLVYTIRSTIGLMMPIWSEEFGWSRSMISSGGALCLIVMAIIAPFAGSAVDKYGARPFVVGGLLAVALSAVLLATMQSAWMFFIAFSLLSGIGFGVVAMHVIVASVSPLFDENKGLAVGIATAGSTAGQLLIIPIVAVFLVSFGWRETYIVYAVICAIVALLCWRVAICPTSDGQPKQSNRTIKFLAKLQISSQKTLYSTQYFGVFPYVASPQQAWSKLT